MGHRYRVAQVGLGARGTVHADAFLQLDDRYEVVGLCELREDRLREYARSKDLSPDRLYTDTEVMLSETRPDVFCFITQPTVSRLGFVELAANYGVRAVAMEKPMASSLSEAQGIVQICRDRGIRGVVSHQQKYLTSLASLHQAVQSGWIGEVELITATCQAFLAQLGTHFVDYVLWVAGFEPVDWVVGHVHGRGLLSDSHASPDYVMGQIGFASGLRAWVEFGRLSRSYMDAGKYWLDNRLTVYGSQGHVWADTDGRWGGLIDGRTVEEQGEGWGAQERTRLQPLYLAELADWLDGKQPDHFCNVEHAYAGYEVMEALCLSAMDHVRVDLPLTTGDGCDMIERMRVELPECLERPRTESANPA